MGPWVEWGCGLCPVLKSFTSSVVTSHFHIMKVLRYSARRGSGWISESRTPTKIMLA